MAKKKTIKEKIARDSMGSMKLPKGALYGASTQRAVLNFPVSGRVFSREFIAALGQIKLSAAKTNLKLKQLKANEANAIVRAAGRVVKGEFDDQFVVDIFQTGSGTSTNMNANEVIATLAKKSVKGIHPNDHVNKGQSSNDVIPTVIHIAVLLAIKEELLPELERLSKSLSKKGREFKSVYKIGRTHLQDATPITLGQEFSGFAEQIVKAVERLKNTFSNLRELPIGGTAVGSGINTHPRFAKEVCRDLSKILKEKFVEARNHFEAQSSKDTCVEVSGALKTTAVSLMKIANDIRWLGSGPRAGLFEIVLPETQPGSSIMPGKVNPVIAESVMQVAAEVIGNDTTVALSAASGNFELNVMMPVIAFNLLESTRLLTNVSKIFRTKCIDGIKANKAGCEAAIEKSLMLSTPLVPYIGYDEAAKLAKKAYKEGKTIREVALESGLLSASELKEILNVRNMVGSNR